MARVVRGEAVAGIVVALLAALVAAADPAGAVPCAVDGHVGIGIAGPSGSYLDRPEVHHVAEDTNDQTQVQVSIGESTIDVDEPITFRVEAVSGTAVVGEDVLVPDTVHVIDPAENWFATVPFTVVDDGEVEGNERFELRLVDVTGAEAEMATTTVVIGEPTWPAVTITDPEGTLLDPGLVEGDDIADEGVVRFELDHEHDREVVVEWGLDEDGGRMGLVPDGGEVTIPAGDTFADLTIATVPDEVHDASTGQRTIQIRDVEGARRARFAQRVLVVEDDPRDGPSLPAPTCTGDDDPAEPVAPGDDGISGVQVLAGATRNDSSVVVSRARFPYDQTVDEVVLASGLGVQGWADALTGVSLAASRNAPLLLTTPERVPSAVLAEMHRLLRPGGRVVLLGGHQAISSEVARDLASTWSVSRISGADRIATSLAVADAHGRPEVILVTAGHTFADALAAGPVAARDGGVVLLTSPDSADPRVEAYLRRHQDVRAYAIGGPAARAHPSLRQIVGEDREATSVAVSQTFFPDATNVGLARSDIPVDALAAGPLMGEGGGPLLLTPSPWLHTAVDDHLCASSERLDGATVFGGSIAVEEPVVQGIRDRLVGECSTPAGQIPVVVTLDDTYPIGTVNWEAPPELHGLDLHVDYPTSTTGGTIRVTASICNPTDRSIGLDLIHPGTDRANPVDMYLSYHPDLVREREKLAAQLPPGYRSAPEQAPAPGPGPPEPLPSPVRSAGQGFLVVAADPLVRGLDPGACRTFTWDWDRRLPDGTAAPAGRWLLSVTFSPPVVGEDALHEVWSRGSFIIE